ncbi:centrosomal protein 43 isoform 2-T2 [Aulostomus maculatus]
MSATEDDTELRDLLIQNLENNGVLNKLKAEMRAAVFLAMEEQDKLENKSPLVNESLKKCLSTKDGRLVASLIVDFLQVFHLDFSLSVFQPEINSLNSLESREQVCRDLGLSESEVNRSSPLLLDLVRRGRHKSAVSTEEPSLTQVAQARKTFDLYDKDRSGSVLKEDLERVFADLFPSLSKTLLDKFIADELRTADSSLSHTDFQLFLGLYKRLFTQCRSVVVQGDVAPPPCQFAVERIISPPLSEDPEGVVSLSKRHAQQPGLRRSEASDSLGLRKDLDLEVDADADDGDSFFDDPLPKPQKTYGCSSLFGETDASEKTNEKVEASGGRECPAGSLSEGAPRPGGSTSDPSSRNGSNSRGKAFRDSKAPNDRTGSLHLEDEVEYDDDFNSHRSDFSKSEVSIGEEIEEVSIEGPETSDKFDDTQDLSVSQLSQSHGVDYMEEVA